MRLVFIDTITDPLCNNLFYSVIDRTAGVHCRTSIHHQFDGVRIREKGCHSALWFDVDMGSPKMGVSSLICDATVKRSERPNPHGS